MAYTGAPAWGPGSAVHTTPPHIAPAAWGGPTLLQHSAHVCTCGTAFPRGSFSCKCCGLKRIAGNAIFDALDANRDGVITRNEFERLVQFPLKVEMEQNFGICPPVLEHSYMPFSHEVLVEVSPQLTPQFTNGPNGTFILQIPRTDVVLSTKCTPSTPLVRYEPHEVMPIVMPELLHVVFDPGRDFPRGGRLSSSITKCGDVLEFDSSNSVGATVKTKSPHGNISVGSTMLNWRLHVEGHVTVKKGEGNLGASRLQVELRFFFDCNIGQSHDIFATKTPTIPPAWCPAAASAAMCQPWKIGRPDAMPTDFSWTSALGSCAEDTLNTLIEVMPSLQPTLEKEPSGIYVMTVPSIFLKVNTSCTPPPLVGGSPAFQPFEEIPISMPELFRVVFDPESNMPREGRLSCATKVPGHIMSFLPTFNIDAKLKTNSPHGSVSLTNVTTGKDVILNWKLQVDGKLEVVKDAGVAGSNRLDGELLVRFECHLCI